MSEKIPNYQQKLKMHGRKGQQEPRCLFRGVQVLVRNFTHPMMDFGGNWK